MKTAYLVEEVLPVRFLDRDAKGLPENCFQLFYHLYVDGVDTGSGAADPASFEFYREHYGFTGELKVVHTFFGGFQYEHRRGKFF